MCVSTSAGTQLPPEKRSLALGIGSAPDITRLAVRSRHARMCVRCCCSSRHAPDSLPRSLAPSLVLSLSRQVMIKSRDLSINLPFSALPLPLLWCSWSARMAERERERYAFIFASPLFPTRLPAIAGTPTLARAFHTKCSLPPTFLSPTRHHTRTLSHAHTHSLCTPLEDPSQASVPRLDGSKALSLSLSLLPCKGREDDNSRCRGRNALEGHCVSVGIVSSLPP